MSTRPILLLMQRCGLWAGLVLFLLSFPAMGESANTELGSIPDTIWKFNKTELPADTLGWGPGVGFRGTFQVTNGALMAVMEKPYAYSNVRETNFQAEHYPFFEIRLKTSRKCAGKIGIYFKTQKTGQLSDTMAISRAARFSGEWQNVVLDLKACTEWRGTITGFRIDFSAEPGLELNVSYIRFFNALSSIPNNTFVDKTDSGKPEKWNVDLSDKNVDFAMVDATNGQTDVRMKSESANGKILLRSDVIRNFMPKDLFKFKVKYKNALGSSGKNDVTVTLLDCDDNILPESVVVGCPVMTNYSVCESKFKIPDNACGVQIALGFSGKGEAIYVMPEMDKLPKGAVPDTWRSSWIADPDPERCTKAGFQYFRKAFDLPGAPSDARIQLTADDKFELFVNGIKVPVFERQSWRDVQVLDITGFLHAGKNLLAVKIFNYCGPSGLLANCKIYFNGGSIEINSDENWRILDKDYDGWEKDYGFEGGRKPIAMGLPPVAPWGSMSYTSLGRRNVVRVANIKAPGKVDVNQELDLAMDVTADEIITPVKSIEIGAVGYAGTAIFSDKIDLEVPLAKAGDTVSVRAKIFRGKLLAGNYRLCLAPDNIIARNVRDNNLSAFEVTMGGAAEKRVSAKVDRFYGNPTMFINELPYFQSMYSVGMCIPPRYLEEFIQIGFDRYLLWVTAPQSTGSTTPTWLAPGEYSYAMIDSAVNKILGIAPRAQIILTYGVDAPEWWNKLYPDQCVKFADKSSNEGLSSPASSLWLKESGESLKNFIMHVEQSPYSNHIIGYRVAAHESGGEWQYLGGWSSQHADYSPAMIQYFHAWLKNHYGNVKALRTAWNNPAVDFDNAEIPSPAERSGSELFTFRDVSKSRNVADYLKCHNDSMADAAVHFLKIVKENAPAKLAGLYGGYVFFYNGFQLLNTGHLSFAKVYKSGYADFVCSPIDYTLRGLGLPAGNHGPVASLKLHNILYVMENDTRTFLAGAKHLQDATNLYETINCLRRDFFLQLTQNIGMYWYDFDGLGWYSNSGILNALSNMKKIGDASVKFPASFRPQVALLYSTESIYYLTEEKSRPLTRASSFNLRSNVGLSGVPCDQYLLEDVLDPAFPEYKAYILVNAFAPSEKVIAAINNKLKKNGAFLIWGYAPGMFKDGLVSLANMKMLSGFEFAMEMKEITPAIKTTAVNSGILQGFQNEDFGGSFGVGPFFYISDPEAVNLGVMLPSKKTGFAMKKMDGWTSIYCAAPEMTPKLFRNIFREAGAHVFTEGDDAIYYNERFLGIYSATQGNKKIYLPVKTNIYDVFLKKNIDTETKSFEVEMPEGKASLYFLGSNKEWESFVSMLR